MDGYASDAASVTSRNNYAGLTATGVWLGMWLGAFTIIPTTILGIITLPFTAPIVFWKSIDQCANNTDFLMCVVAFFHGQTTMPGLVLVTPVLIHYPERVKNPNKLCSFDKTFKFSKI